MSDVRLTATNPEDSSVVPVACDAGGRLLLQELPPEFDGNLDGDLTVSGKGTFAGGNITLNANGSAELSGTLSFDGAGQTKCGATNNSLIQFGTPKDNSAGLLLYKDSTLGPSGITTQISSSDGSAEFAGTIESPRINLKSSAASENVVATYVRGSATSQWTAEGNILLGNLDNGGNIILKSPAGSGTFKGTLTAGDYDTNSNGVRGLNYEKDEGLIVQQLGNSIEPIFTGLGGNSTDVKISMLADGSAEFAGDVVIGSRNKQWMIVESGGIAHLVEQTFRDTTDIRSNESSGKYPQLRNIPDELTMVEHALKDVMDKLRMTPPAGWPVWDGSDD